MNHYLDSMQALFDEEKEKHGDRAIIELPYEDEFENYIELSLMDSQAIETQFEIRNLFKDLFETYKTVIEVVRMNNKLEDFMSVVCERLFNFLVKYERK